MIPAPGREVLAVSIEIRGKLYSGGKTTLPLRGQETTGYLLRAAIGGGVPREQFLPEKESLVWLEEQGLTKTEAKLFLLLVAADSVAARLAASEKQSRAEYVRLVEDMAAAAKAKPEHLDGLIRGSIYATSKEGQLVALTHTSLPYLPLADLAMTALLHDVGKVQ